MINVLRKNQKGLWIVIALLCIPFVFYFSKSDLGRITNNDLGHIYGRTVSQIEFQRSARLFNLARDLGMVTFLQGMIAGAQSQEDAYRDFTWNHIILHHEADRLGLHPTVGEIAAVVKGLPVFQTDGRFDSKKYSEFAQNYLPSMGFGEAQVEELAGDQLTLGRLKEVVGVGAIVPETEAKENYERSYGKLSVAVARVNSEDLARTVQVNDEDVAKYYEARKTELKSEEKRRISLVTFALNEEQKKLTGKERVEALQKLADRANDFTQALLEKGAQFDQVAAKFQLPVQVTGDFPKTKPDPFLSGNPQLADAAFALKLDDPNSEAHQAGDGFVLLHLVAVDEPKPLSLEEAKPKVVEAIKGQRVAELVAAKGAEAAQKLREALKSGTPLEAALQQTGLPTEKLPPFALADPPATTVEPGKPPQPASPDIPIVKGAVAELSPGEVSQFIPTQTGGLLVVLEKRDQPDPASYEKSKALFNTRALNNKREVAFYEWMRERRRDAGVRPTVAAPGEEGAG
jgi:peptidyl-prolyl cis-trans isomerase D